MKKLTLTILALTTLLLLTACGNAEQQSPGEQLRNRLMSLGNEAKISSQKDMEAIWNFMDSNKPLDDEGLHWKLTDECTLNIIGGRNLISLVEGENITYLTFITTIDCPKDVSWDDVSHITPRGTYTNNCSTVWFLGKEKETTEIR